MTDRIFTILRYSFFFALILFGSLTLLSFLGVDAHLAVLLSDDTKQSMVTACGDGVFCREWYALFPFVLHALSRVSTFGWYVVWSIVAFAFVLIRTYMRTGEWRVQASFSPLKIILLFLASVWVMFTMFSLGNNGNADNPIPNRRLFDVSSGVYSGATDQELEALQENLDGLKARGCLSLVGQLNSGGSVYDMSLGCMQQSFFTRVFSQMVMVLVVLFSMLVLGSVFLRRVLKVDTRTRMLGFVFSLTTGACLYTALLWLFAVLAFWTHLPLYSMPVGWLIVLGIPAAFYKTSLGWLRAAKDNVSSYDAPWYGISIVLGWFLLSYLAFNFLSVIRPFPIGWDDLGRYLNQPHLLVSYGQFIPTMPTFQWEYITSLGFLLFGYDSIFGTTLSLLMNWMGGLFAILVILAFGQAYLGKRNGILAALLYYTLPLVGHFSFADMKIDNGLFAVGALSMVALFLGFFRTVEDEENDAPERPWADRRSWIILAGMLAGFAFGMKATAIMIAMTLGCVLVGATLGGYGFVGATFIAWFFYAQQNRFDVADLSVRAFGSPTALSKSMLVGVFLLLGLGFLGYAFSKKKHLIRVTFVSAGILIASFAAAILPWIAFNNVSNGNVIPDISMSVPNMYAPVFVTGKGQDATSDEGRKVIALPDDLRVDLNNPACVSTAGAEELDRYWGDHPGLLQYVTLPWRSVMNLDSAGYYVTTIPALLLFPLLLLLPFFWMKQGRWLRWLFLGTGFLILQWIFFANGIPWYGIGMFLGFAVVLETFVARAPDGASAIAASVFIGLSLASSFSHRMWQYEQQRNLIEYPIGKISANALEERTITHYDDIRRSVEQRAKDMPEQPYLYRIGTFIPYFIPQNLERIPLGDQQLDFFTCLNQEKNPALTLRRLQALGFNAIVFDTNTQTIEKDENGSLHKKVNAFADFVNTPDIGLDIAVFDPDGGIAYILLPPKQ